MTTEHDSRNDDSLIESRQHITLLDSMADVTGPRPARFNSYINRELPKSTEDKEEELMEYFRSHPFRANPIRFRTHPELDDVPSIPSPKLPRTVTKTMPFNFHCDKRANRIEAPTDDTIRILHNQQNQMENKMSSFHAMDMAIQSNDVRKTTIPDPFHLRIDERIKKRNSSSHCSKEVEVHEASSHVQVVSNSSRKRSTGPFQLATTLRHETHQKQLQEKMRQEDADRKKLAEFRALEWNPQSFEYNDKHRYMRSNNKHIHVPKSADEGLDTSLHELSEWYKANNVGAFDLLSVKRHEVYRRQFSERIKKQHQEDEIKVRSMSQPRHSSDWQSFQEYKTGSSVEDNPMSKKTKAVQESFNSSKIRSVPLVQSKNLPCPVKLVSLEAKDSSSTTCEDVIEQDSSESTMIFSWRTLALFIMICLFRILNTLLVQSYFDPDEFWQTMEPAYCQVFVTDQARCPGYTWEWKRRAPITASNIVESSMEGPARSYLSIVPAYCYFHLLKYFGIDTLWLVSRGPLILNAVIVAAPIDMAVWYVGRWLEPRKNQMYPVLPLWCLFCSLSSWFNGYTLVRTLANCQENLLLIASVMMISPELIGNVNRRYFLPRSCLAFLLGGLAVVIRFTAVAAFIPIGMILALRSKKYVSRLWFLIFPCATFGLVGILIGALIDRIFFGFWTIPFLGNFHFNVILGFAALYGAHPWHWYFSAGVPAITGLILPFALFDIYLVVRSHGASYGRRNLWIIVLSYLVIMSFNAHKEFRYILPMLPLLCLLTASHVRTIMTGRTGEVGILRLSMIGSVFVTANLIAVLYLGMFHQSGSISVNHRIVTTSRELYRSAPERSNYSVHYLTGACHSTPLLSHLHSPPLRFDDVWHLDCSPDCRSDSNRLCESERFAIDPVTFIEESYYPCNKVSRLGRNSCLATSPIARLIPDFIVTFSTFCDRIRPHLANEGLYEIARFPQNLNGLKIGSFVLGEKFFLSDTYRHISVVSGLLEASIDDVVLFARMNETDKQCTV
jgi:GPI mannosyltransferase 3